MTQEYPLNDKEDYEFPALHFKKLNEYPVNSSHYSLVKGSLYDELVYGRDISQEVGLDISRMLSQGRIETAREKVESLLENGGK